MKIINARAESRNEIINCSHIIKVVQENNDLIIFLTNNKTSTVQNLTMESAKRVYDDILTFLQDDNYEVLIIDNDK